MYIKSGSTQSSSGSGCKTLSLKTKTSDIFSKTKTFGRELTAPDAPDR